MSTTVLNKAHMTEVVSARIIIRSILINFPDKDRRFIKIRTDDAI